MSLEPRTLGATQPRTPPVETHPTRPRGPVPPKIRLFWPLLAATGALMAALVVWAVLDLTATDQVRDDHTALPAGQDSSTDYGSQGEIPPAFAPGARPAPNPAGVYGSRGEIPNIFTHAAVPGSDAAVRYGTHGEIPDTFSPRHAPRETQP